MRAGNARYRTVEDFPATMPVFPLAGALLLPGSHLPLNIFEPRYLAMIDHVLAVGRTICMVQPQRGDMASDESHPPLSQVGCIGRVTSFSETGDGRYLISLAGICRGRLVEEVPQGDALFRSFHVAPLLADLSVTEEERDVDRDQLMKVFRAYLDTNRLEADWESIEKAGNLALVNSLCMMSPFGPPEKQALLEAENLKDRSATLIAMLQMLLARATGGGTSTLQ